MLEEPFGNKESKGARKEQTGREAKGSNVVCTVISFRNPRTKPRGQAKKIQEESSPSQNQSAKKKSNFSARGLTSAIRPVSVFRFFSLFLCFSVSIYFLFLTFSGISWHQLAFGSAYCSVLLLCSHHFERLVFSFCVCFFIVGFIMCTKRREMIRSLEDIPWHAGASMQHLDHDMNHIGNSH
ncbi:hypothetical protein V8C42DRAFT_155553 [Trichoderma barbatum]